jgi:hypothetical protein
MADISGGQAYYAPRYKAVSINKAFVFDGGPVNTKYRTTSTLTGTTETFTANQLTTDLTDGYDGDIVAGSARFTVANRTYVDRNGTLYHTISPTTNAGTLGGAVQYGSGLASISDWVEGGANSVAIGALVTEVAGQDTSALVFRVPIVPIRVSSLQILGTFTAGVTFNVTADSSGNLSASGIKGVVNYQTGIVKVQFGTVTTITAANRAAIEANAWYSVGQEYQDGAVTKILVPNFVRADTIRFNAVGFTYLPLAANILGLDPVRLPSDGRVPIYRAGSVIVVNCTKRTQFAAATANQILNVGDTRLSMLKVIDSANTVVSPSSYTVDLDSGIVTLGAGFSNAGLTLPLLAEYRIEDLALVTDVQINGSLTLNRPLTHAYPAYDTLISSALLIGDMQAHQSNLFSQASWANDFENVRQGSPIPAQYNAPLYPIVVTNKGAIQERWALVFTSNNAYRIIGESVGQIGTGDINTNISPLNPATGTPYFTIVSQGWGSGWVAGNTLRFNTAAANYPIWAARTVLQGQATSIDDKFTIQVRGDIDRS